MKHAKSISLLTLLFLLSLVSFLPSLQAADAFCVYDMRALQNVDRANPADVRRVWDETLLVSALQGLANRDDARLYLLYCNGFNGNSDVFWLDLFSKEIPCDPPKKGWLQDRERVEIGSLDELLTTFSDSYDGVVLYDEKVYSTVNAALTIAGVENLLPVRYDPSAGTIYDRYVANGPKLPVKARLVAEDGSSLFTGKGKIPGTTLDSTGSAKADAYYWLIENYIKTGKVNAAEGGYYIDAYWLDHPIGATQNHCLTNRDFTLSRKGFFFDLSPWDDETPNDDREQPLGTDFKAFNAIMRAAYDATAGKQVIRVCGFTPWDTKYTDYGPAGCKHGGVPTEWRHAEILSNYNGYLDADALGLGAMANASFYQHYKLDDVYPLSRPTLEELQERGFVDANGQVANKTFVAIYAGDYDSAAWVYQSQTSFWFDAARGEVPINWAFNPNLADRFAPAFDYFRRTKSANDYFVSGDSGAGYVNPEGFVEPRKFSGLPDALDIWIEHSLEYFKRWDLGVIGFIIDGDARTSSRETLERLSKYSPDGMMTHRGNIMGVVDNPYGGKTAYRSINFDINDPAQGANIVLGDVRADKGAQFNTYRTILWSPSKLKELSDRVHQDARGSRVEFVDYYTFWMLLRLEAERLGVNELDVRL